MVCLNGGIICVPNYSRTGIRLCLDAQVRCNGEDDCLNGLDEEDCAGSIGNLSTGLQAFIAAAVVIAVVVLVPIIYAVVRRQQGKAIIPRALRPIWDRITPCCSKTKDVDRSSQQLTGAGHRNASPISADKDGFTNVAFERNQVPSSSRQQYSVTGKPLNKFKQAVETTDLERSPSYRDWQANRLQHPKQSSKVSSAESGFVESAEPVHSSRGHRIQHTVELNTRPPEPYNPRPVNNITYAPSVQRTGTQQNLPYAIASPDGKSTYEARSHVQQTYNPSTNGRQSAPWEQHVARGPSQYQISSAKQKAPPNYDTYASVSSAVPPNQLREALERVAVSSSAGASYSRDIPLDHNPADDTVV